MTLPLGSGSILTISPKSVAYTPESHLNTEVRLSQTNTTPNFCSQRGPTSIASQVYETSSKNLGGCRHLYHAPMNIDVTKPLGTLT